MLAYQAAEINRLYAPKTFGVPAESYRTVRDRVIMMWEARDLVENSESASTALSKFSNNVVPNEWAPNTGDRDYNILLAEWFHEEWCKDCDIQRRHTFKKLIQIGAEQRPCDGDFGYVLRDTANGIRIQSVDAPRIDNPNMSAHISPNYFSGVITDEVGAPIAYRVYRITREGVYADFEDIPARFFLHYFDPFRIDQYRGITAFHSTSRTLRMQKETLEAENVAQVNKSRHAAIVFNERGQAPQRQAFQQNSPKILPNGDPEMQEFTGVARVLYMKRGDSVQTMPARPGDGFLDYQNYTDHLVARGLDLPYGSLFGTDGYKGSNIRAEFAQADRAYDRHRGVLEPKVITPIKNAAILDAIARGVIPLPPRQPGEDIVDTLKRALRGQWRYPAKLTIDVGNESAANLGENRQGLKSPQRIAAENNSDAFQTADEIVAWQKYLQEACEREGVPEAAVRLLTNMIPQTPVAAAASGPETAAAGAETQIDATGAAAPAAPRKADELRAKRIALALAGPRARTAAHLDTMTTRHTRLSSIRAKMGDRTADTSRITDILEKLKI